eukprot:1882292-Amphidinium_carterae.1
MSFAQSHHLGNAFVCLATGINNHTCFPLKQLNTLCVGVGLLNNIDALTKASPKKGTVYHQVLHISQAFLEVLWDYMASKIWMEC